MWAYASRLIFEGGGRERVEGGKKKEREREKRHRKQMKGDGDRTNLLGMQNNFWS